MKKILIVNHYAGCPKYGPHLRSFHIAKELVERGMEVCVVASSYTHLRKTPSVKTETIDGVHFIWLKTPKYNNYGITRLLNMVVFSLRLFFLRKVPFTPDSIILSSPSPFPAVNARRLKKKYKAKLIYEIRDVWPKTIIELNGTSPKHPLMRWIDWLDSYAIKNADYIASPLHNIAQYIREKGYDKKCVIVPNGIAEVKLNTDRSHRPSSDIFTVGYGGTISDSNSIMNLIEAARILRNEQKIRFEIVGEGNRFEDVKKLIEKENLANIKIHGKLPQKEMFSIFETCDILYKGNPRKDIYKYGISSIKVPEYLLLKKPIIDASFGVDIVEKSNCGLCVEHENPQALANGIQKMKSLSKSDLDEMANNGYDYVIENYLYRNTVSRLLEIL